MLADGQVAVARSARSRSAWIPESGVLRLPESLLFDSAEAVLRPEGAPRAARARGGAGAHPALLQPGAARFSRATARSCPSRCSRPCWSKATPTTCRSAPPQFGDNWELASARAINTYKALLGFQPSLGELQNAQRRGAARGQRLRGAPAGLGRADRRRAAPQPAHRSALSDRRAIRARAERDPPRGRTGTYRPEVAPADRACRRDWGPPARRPPGVPSHQSTLAMPWSHPTHQPTLGITLAFLKCSSREISPRS